MCFCIICVVYIACILLYVSCMHVTYTGLLRAGPEPGKNISGPPWTVLPPSCMVPGCCRCSCGHPPPPSLLSPSRNAFGLRPQGAHGMRGGGGGGSSPSSTLSGWRSSGCMRLPTGLGARQGNKGRGNERTSKRSRLPACLPANSPVVPFRLVLQICQHLSGSCFCSSL